MVSFLSFVFISRFLYVRAWTFLFTVIKYGGCQTNAESSSQDFFFFSISFHIYQ